MAPRVDLAYNAAGQFTGLTRYADLAGTLLVASTTYSYDPAGRLTSLTHAQGATTLADYDWTFDPAGRVTQFVSLLDGTTDYAYDQTDQLTAADHTGQKDESYAYDANGNRTGGGYQTGTGNQLLSDWSTDYQYDAEGNRTRKREIPILVAGADAGGGPHVRVYDAQTGVERFNSFAYDVFDRRLASSAASCCQFPLSINRPPGRFFLFPSTLPGSTLASVHLSRIVSQLRPVAERLLFAVLHSIVDC